MREDNTKPRSLSTGESKVLLDLEWRGATRVTTHEVKEILGGSDVAARVMVHRLARKGWLEPLKRGLYLVVPANRGPQGIVDANPLAIGPQLVGEYFYSFATASSFHHLSEQSFSTVYLVCRRAQPTRQVRDTRYVFVRVPAERFFGFEEVNALGAQVQMATVERCLLDAVHRPALVGGLSEVSRIVRAGASRVSWPRLLEYAQRWRESATLQRLGYLLDLHDMSPEPAVRDQLGALVNRESKIRLGDPKRWGSRGRFASEWGIVENVPKDVLIDPAEGARRPLQIPRPRG